MKMIKLHMCIWLLLASLPSICHAQSDFESFYNKKKKYKDALVKEVISADTIRLKNNEIVKLIGLRAPKTPRHKENVERDEFGFIIKGKGPIFDTVEEMALAYTIKLLEGKKVRLEFDINRKDEDFITTAYVYLIEGDVFANTEILKEGYAFLKISPPNTKHVDELRAAYREAYKEKRGLQNN